MRAHFIGSIQNLKSDIANYRIIISALEGHDVNIVSDWLTEAEGRLKKPASLQPTWQEIYISNINAISKSDVIVAEVSSKSFLVGFQVALALQMKKPVLMLSIHNETSSASGVSSQEEIIQFHEYNSATISDIIKNFVHENKQGGKNIRFNFFVNRKILNYLKWASLRTGQSKSEIIRNVLMEEIKKSDFK